MRPRRTWIGIAIGTAATLGWAGGAAAQSHYLLARTNGSFNGQGTFDVDVSHVEHVLQEGVGGVNPSYYAITASTDGASGVMAITGSFGLLGGAADAIQPPATYHSATRIAQDLDPGTPTGDTVTVRATLIWSGAAQINSPNDVERADVSAQLRVEDCQAYFRRSLYSNGLVEENPIDCSNSYATGSAGGGAITVTEVYPAAAITGFTRFHIDAQLAADVDNPLDYSDSGQYQVSGVLSVSVEGVTDYVYASPTFLTAPEADAALSGACALLGLAALRRSRRG